MSAPDPVDAVLAAAGSGRREGGDPPKQFRPLGGRPLVRWAAEALAADPRIRRTVAVVAPEREGDARAALAGLGVEVLPRGGPTRASSVRAGLERLAADPPAAVLVHDAARPRAGPETVGALLGALARAPAAVPALAVADTLKEADGGGRVRRTLPREGLFRAQTPQGFRFAPLLEAHRRAGAAGFPDDARAMEEAGREVLLVPGDPLNRKVTGPGDLALLERLLVRRIPRTGQGLDVHRLVPGGPLRLLGADIPHDRGLEGHSDADAGLHAVTDAILGALAEGDIGQHFPASDPRWRGADSAAFVRFARDRAAARGAEVAHVDVTLVCEAPALAPHREAMRAACAGALGVAPGRVAVKATTSEGLGFAGRGEGIAALALATLLLPAEEA